MVKAKPGLFDSPLLDLSAYHVQAKSKDMVESFHTTEAIAENMRKASSEIVWPDNYYIANTEKVLAKLAKHIESVGEFNFDTETQGLNPWRNKLYCITFSVEGEGYLVPLEHQLMSCIDKALVHKYLTKAFGDPKIKRGTTNGKFDSHMVEEQLKIPVSWLYYDTLVQSQVINPDPTTEHGLKQLCAQYGIAKNTGDYTDQFGKTAWSYLPHKLAAYYAIHDTELSVKLHAHQNQILEGLKDWKTGELRLKSLFWDVEMPMVNLTHIMERTGVLIDPEYFSTVLKPTVYKEWKVAAEELEPYIAPHLKYAEADTVAQVLDSPTKLAKVYFDKLNIPLIKYVTLKPEANWQFTIKTLDKDAIIALSKTCKPIKLLGTYRKWATVKKMFVDALPQNITDNRAHPVMNVIGAATGRMSLRAPNLQQIPSRMGPLVRKLFIPEPGKIFMSCDFSGQEMRILASYTGDPKLTNFYTHPNGLDIYSQTAIDAFPREAFDKSKTTREAFAKMSKGDRKEVNAYRDAKSLVLGLGYGLGSASYARKTGKTSQEGKADFDAYHNAYPYVGVYHEKCKAFTRKHGYITTLLGRRRYLSFINSTGEKGLRAAAERAAMNVPIQGSAADMLKIAALKVWKLIHKNKWPIRIVLMVHDEIIFEMPTSWPKERPDTITQITEAMCTALPLKVPMESSVTFETRWGESVDVSDLDDLVDDLAEEV